jgi:hypothetical protein
MTISFQNLNNEIITSEQANLLTEYEMVYSDSGKIKKKELFIEKFLYHIKYYLDPDEGETDVIDALSATGVKFSIVIKANTGNYLLENIDEYSGNTLIFKSRGLYDAIGSLIGSEEKDIGTNNPQYKKTEKYFYDLNTDDYFPLFTAYYNADGSLNYIAYDSYRFDGQDEIIFSEEGQSGINDISTLQRYLSLNDNQITYYLTASLDLTPG